MIWYSSIFCIQCVKSFDAIMIIIRILIRPRLFDLSYFLYTYLSTPSMLFKAEYFNINVLYSI